MMEQMQKEESKPVSVGLWLVHSASKK